MFPAEEAARIAVETVRKYLDEQDRRYSEVSSYIGSGAGQNAGGDTYKGIEKVIFNVFSDRDRQIYENILEK
jgi:O-acetyl-ADP-ribose deacetylase (regulator of RNase III)